MARSSGLVKCGRCGKQFTNPFTHVCVTRIGARRKGKTRLVKPKAPAVKCGTCGKPYSNPLTHTCTSKTDFKARKAKAEKHPEPEDCRDAEECDQYGCRMFWRGFDLGRAAGFQAGYNLGHAEGYSKGHADGRAEGYDEGYAAGAASAGSGAS